MFWEGISKDTIVSWMSWGWGQDLPNWTRVPLSWRELMPNTINLTRTPVWEGHRGEPAAPFLFLCAPSILMRVTTCKCSSHSSPNKFHLAVDRLLHRNTASQKADSE